MVCGSNRLWTTWVKFSSVLFFFTVQSIIVEVKHFAGVYVTICTFLDYHNLLTVGPFIIFENPKLSNALNKPI